MSKLIIEDGKHYRMRRGKKVEIPPQWVGRIPSKSTILKRPSKKLHKHRKIIKYGNDGSFYDKKHKQRIGESSIT